MKTKYFLFAGVLFVLFMLTACGKKTEQEAPKEPSAYEKVHSALIGLESYVSNATVEYISNKNSNVYETIQHAKMNGRYRIEVIGPENVVGNITMSDSNVIYQYNPKISGKISTTTNENQERSEIFVTSFLKNYLNSEEVSVGVGNFEDGQVTILEATVPGKHRYLSTQKLWVDNETLKPVKLVVFDADGIERIIVTYSNFEYNVELDDNLFTLKQ